MPRRTIKGSGKKVPLNMRTTAELRAKIERAAGKSGRSMVQEVEYRVEASFYEDNYAVLLLLLDETRQDMATLAHILQRYVCALDALDPRLEKMMLEKRDAA